MKFVSSCQHLQERYLSTQSILWMSWNDSGWFLPCSGKEYSKGDSRYVARDAATVTVEGITAVLEGPASLLAVYVFSSPTRLTSSYAAYFVSCPTYVLSSQLLFTKFNQTWLCDGVKISGCAVMPYFPVGNEALRYLTIYLFFPCSLSQLAWD